MSACCATSVKRTGINPDQFQHKVAASEGVGGPEIPLDQVHVEGITDPRLRYSAYLRAGAVLNQLNGLSSEMRHIPLPRRSAGAAFRPLQRLRRAARSLYRPLCLPSGRGFRRPLGRGGHARPRRARWFSPAIAAVMATWWKSTMASGIHTRYGHLSAITVRGGHEGRQRCRGRTPGVHRPQHRPACPLRSLV